MNEKILDIDCQSVEMLFSLEAFQKRIMIKKFEVGDYLVSQGDSFCICLL
ncbi:hypothetical protein [Flavobacterium davisii]|uniref:Uncharacterized protein n=1 Tax=Flavobacterium columnare TaxID=996 RepID=A0A8G0KWQ3_9FLAO|nr:hypothetical protein [Flavobacterium davisii]QYS88625.1 hypothetical protein JJC05_13625 [Flavobacterium davisii]